MTSSIFLVKNINILLLSIESLDLYTIDSFLTNSEFIKINEFFIFRYNTLLTYNNQYKKNRLYYITIILHLIIEHIGIQYLRKNIRHILKDISVNNLDSSDYSLHTQNYIQRFILNYRIHFEPHLTGYSKYTNEAWIMKISIVNLFLLYELCESKKLYHFFIYLKYHNTHS